MFLTDAVTQLADEVLRGRKRDRRRARVAISLIRLVASVSFVHEPPPPIVTG
jgi:hypothetical protein